MRKMKKWILAAILICGAMMGTSCQGFIDAVIGTVDNPAPSTTLPKSYYLVADEYKEVLLDPLLEVKYASIVQDPGEKFTIDSPKSATRQATPQCTATISARCVTGSEPRCFLWNIR